MNQKIDDFLNFLLPHADVSVYTKNYFSRFLMSVDNVSFYFSELSNNDVEIKIEENEEIIDTFIIKNTEIVYFLNNFTKKLEEKANEEVIENISLNIINKYTQLVDDFLKYTSVEKFKNISNMTEDFLECFLENEGVNHLVRIKKNPNNSYLSLNKVSIIFVIKKESEEYQTLEYFRYYCGVNLKDYPILMELSKKKKADDMTTILKDKVKNNTLSKLLTTFSLMEQLDNKEKSKKIKKI